MPEFDVTIFNVAADEPGGDDAFAQLTGAEAPAQSSAVSANEQANNISVTLEGAAAQAIGGAPVTWPINGKYAVQGGYMISNIQNNMVNEPGRTDNGSKDILIYQWRNQSTSGKANDLARLQDFDTNFPDCNLVQYTVPGETVKVANFSANVHTKELIEGANGNDTWYLKNAAGTRVEASFDPENFYKCNEADTVVDTNSSGETFSEAFWAMWYDFHDNGRVPILDGIFHDVTPPVPQSVFLNNGATSTNFDYEEDGSATDRDGTGPSGGVTLFQSGVLQWRDNFYTQYGSEKAYLGNITRYGLDYETGDMSVLPVSSNLMYQELDGGTAENWHKALGMAKSAGSYLNNGNGNPVPSKALRRLALMQTCLKPDNVHPWGSGHVLIEFSLNTAYNAIDNEAHRMIGAVAALTRNACGATFTKAVPAPPLDEFVFDWGLRTAPSDPSLGTIDDATSGWTFRAPDYIEPGSGAEFHWDDGWENVIWVWRSDWFSTGSLFGSGTAQQCLLPDPGTNMKWIHPDLQAYTNPLSGRSTRNQAPTINNGTDVDAGGSYGSVSLLPAHARMLQRVPT